MSGERWWLWMAVCVVGWLAAAWLLSLWAGAPEDDRLAIGEHRWPIDDEDGAS